MDVNGFSLRHTFVVTLRTLLKADCQIGNSKMSRCTRKTRILTSASTNLAGLMTWPTNTTLIREAPWRATTDTCTERGKNKRSIVLLFKQVSIDSTKKKKIRINYLGLCTGVQIN